MGLKMKYFNIMVVHHFLGKAVTKNVFGELPKKGGLDNLLGACQKIERKVFLRGLDTSMYTYDLNLLVDVGT